MDTYDVTIVGCGVVGAAIAYTLAAYDLQVLILERENDVATGTSKANSAVFHAGYDPVPGTLMARLNVEGAKLAAEICRELHVPYKKTGALVLAFDEQDLETIRTLYARGRQNGVQGLFLIDGDTVRRLEPNINREVTGALRSTTTAITSPWEYTLAMAENAVQNGATLRLNEAVTGIKKEANGFQILTPLGQYDSRYVVNAAGVDAAAVHALVTIPSYRVIPDRGEYFILDHSEGGLVHHVIFQCPTKRGKGTLVAPTVDGNVLIGPGNEIIFDRHDRRTTASGLLHVKALAERSVPSINFNKTIRTFSGVRATLDQDDFLIEEDKDVSGFINLAGIKSPGLTAAAAIGRHVIELMRESGLALKEKQARIKGRKRVAFDKADPRLRQVSHEANPAYSQIVCHCELVSEGEIQAALDAPIPAASIEAVKRRTRACAGRCQGAHCAPRVAEMLAEQLHIPIADVPLDKAGTSILIDTNKDPT